MTITISGTTGLAGVDGSASTPAVQGADTNTGVFFPAADTVAIATGGTEAMRIDSSGNITVKDKIQFGIDAQTHIQAGGTNDVDIIVAADTNIRFETATNERARIDSSGNAMWNGTNTTSQNGNQGYIYKFFGGNNNLIMPMEVGIGDRYAILEFRQTGRTNSARASQISIGQNSLNQGDVQVYSSGANADISGGVRLSNGATSWSAISDMRLKTVTGTYTNALQDIAKIQAIKFTWKHDQSGTPQVGVSAQSVELVVPEAISTSKNIATPDDETEYLSVRYTELIPLMIASIQEQQAMIVALKAEVDALKGAQA